jgi:hypothetical protein
MTVFGECECASCGEGLPPNDCPRSQRPCGHHCNHVWDQDICHWCGAEVNDEGELVVPVQEGEVNNHG